MKRLWSARTFPTSFFSNVASSADRERVAEYQILVPVQEQVTAGLQEMICGDAAPNPQEVADAVAELVAMPAGSRPLRTLVGQDAVAAKYLNQVAEQTQESWMKQLGMASLMVVSPQKWLAA